jgi:hypothetical protein
MLKLNYSSSDYNYKTSAVLEVAVVDEIRSGRIGR